MGFVAMVGKADIDSIKVNWSENRCFLPVMVAAAWFKPADSPKSGTEFAIENFQFCTNDIIQKFLKTVFAPLQKILAAQFNVVNLLQKPIQAIRKHLNKAVSTFEKHLDSQQRRFKFLFMQTAAGFERIRMMMGRITGVLQSAVQLLLSLGTFIQNTLEFTQNAIIVFILILISLIILIWFVLLPQIPVVLGVLMAMMIVGVGAAAGKAGSFCLDPSSQIRMADGSLKSLSEIKLGDRLATQDPTKQNIVEGILTADSSETPLVVISEVLLSGSHRVLEKGKWILAKDHPNATKTSRKIPHVICLNTSLHEVPVVSQQNGTLWASDWEEVSTEKGQQVWIDTVDIILNGANLTQKPKYPTAVPLVSEETKVYHETKGITPIGSIEIGDRILTQGKSTRVVGVQKGDISVSQISEDSEWISDGVWRFKKGIWVLDSGIQNCGNDSLPKLKGRFLVTEDETFLIFKDGHEILVRDFTEVGASRIEKTQDFLGVLMNECSVS